MLLQSSGPVAALRGSDDRLHAGKRDPRDPIVFSPTPEMAGLDEDQRSEDELVVLLLVRASGVKQKCRHADSSRGRVPQRNAGSTPCRPSQHFRFAQGEAGATVRSRWR
jgi:hypothetical protein